MLTLDVTLNLGVFDTVRTAAHGADPADMPEAVARAVAAEPAFGPERAQIAAAVAEWFELDRMRDQAFWDGQEQLRDAIDHQLAETVTSIEAALPHVGDDRSVPVAVYPVPGMTQCYGAPGGGQLFGLYHGADPREMLLFLSHTYYHELSSSLMTESGRQAEIDPSTPERFRRWLLLLIRHEGIANYAVLGPLRTLRDEQISFHYFKYAPLVDNLAATARAMAACRQLDSMLDQQTVERVRTRVNAVLKNPKLPVINLIGIHMAEAIARHYGERALLDVDQREPEEFLDMYARTDDELREHLLGLSPANPVPVEGSRR